MSRKFLLAFQKAIALMLSSVNNPKFTCTLCRSANQSSTFVRFCHEFLVNRRRAAWRKSCLEGVVPVEWWCFGLGSLPSRKIPSDCERTAYRFTLGTVLITPSARATLNEEDVVFKLARHMLCDWQETNFQHQSDNWFALGRPLRIITDWRDRNDSRFWMATEADRSATTIFLA